MSEKNTASGDICLFCGHDYKSSKLLEIYSEEALKKDLPGKIESYLSVKLSQCKLHLKCCYECISTITHWHNFLQNAVKIFKELNSLENENDNLKPLKLIDSVQSTPSHQNEEENHTSKCNKIENNALIIETEHFSGSVSADDHELDDTEVENSPGLGEHCSEILSSEEEVLNHQNEVHQESIEIPSKSRIETSESKQVRVKVNRKIISEAKITVNGKVYYNCKQCGKNLLSPYSYIWHLKIHTGERPFVCDLCGKQFRVSQGLSRHLKEFHEKIKKYSCDICGRMFTNKRNVDDHRRIHTNERPYVCDMCGKSFKQKASLYVHNRTHTDFFPVECEYCNQKFRTKPSLMTHITKHTGQKPYSCDVCEKCFRIKHELKRHKLVHSEEKPFACSMCSLRFKQNRYLRKHVKSYHTNFDFVSTNSV